MLLFRGNDAMSHVSRNLRRLLGALATVVALSFSAQSGAAAFQVEFDPVAELYGTATFDLTAPCLANDGIFTDFLGLTAAGCIVSLIDAHISITGNGGPYTDYTAILPLVFYSTLVIADHQLLGLTTWPIPIFLTPVVGSSTLLTSGWFHCIPSIGFTAPTNGDPTTGTVIFNGCGADGRPLQPLGGNVVSITQVPEPAPLALLLGGLAAFWSVRRRWQRQRAG